MEALEEVVGVPSKDLFHIVKGKRTKRLRLQSPIIPFSLVTTLSSSHDSLNACNNNIESGSIGNGEGIACNNNNNNNNEILSSAEVFINTFTEEEEETAKCLVLLSKIHDDHHPHPRPRNKFIMEDIFKDDLRPSYKTKFNSKRYVETSTNSVDGTKAGMYVYECKTCNRTFPSFQALGGHRASHKKPKTSLNAEFNRKSYLDFSDEDDYHQQHSPSTTTTTLYNYKNKNNYIKQNMPNSSSPARIHECSYCGAEFTSGQALGGHMRRHRGGANVNSPLHLNNLSPATSIDQEFGNNNNNIIKKKQRDHDELPLDLNNLPVQDDPVLSLKKQDQEQTQRQLVDCHY